MTIAVKIREFILKNYLFTNDTNALRDDESLIDRGIIDSTGAMEVVLFLDEQFGITVADEELIPANLDSVDKLTAFVVRKRGGSAA